MRVLCEAMTEGPSRGFWCQMRSRGKFAYLTIDDAWATAFKLFCFDGRVLLPYHCNTIRVYSADAPRWVGQQNPWRWEPASYIRGRKPLRRTFPVAGRNRKPCGCWHLTRSHAHVLAAATKEPGRVTEPVCGPEGDPVYRAATPPAVVVLRRVGPTADLLVSQSRERLGASNAAVPMRLRGASAAQELYHVEILGGNAA